MQNFDKDSKDHLVFDSKQTAWIACAFLLVLFFVFMVGYFIGKRQALEQFSQVLDQESISDKIYSSLYASYQGKTGIEISENIKPMDSGNATASVATQTPELVTENSAPQSPEPSTEAATDTHAVKYYAPLIGFGSAGAAQKYVDRLTHAGFPVALQSHKSTTAKGRAIQWYQVVTKPFESRVELQALLATLEKREHLKHIKIVTI